MNNLKNQQLSNIDKKSERKPYGPVSEFYQFPIALLEIMEMCSSLKPGTFHEAVKNNLSGIKIIAESMLDMISGRPGELSALSRQNNNASAGFFMAIDSLYLLIVRGLENLLPAVILTSQEFLKTQSIIEREFELWVIVSGAETQEIRAMWLSVLDRHNWTIFPVEIRTFLFHLGTYLTEKEYHETTKTGF